jgi:HK97 family phage prohead protease
MTLTDEPRLEAPTEFTRELAFNILEVRAEPNGDGLTFEGYAAVFDAPTVIDSWEGNFEEIIRRGAFKKTLRERTPVLMFDHGQHPLIGDMPLGRIERAAEDSRGLFIRARLHDNWLIQPVRDAIGSGSVDGMSFRFRAIRDSWTQPSKAAQLPKRELLELSVPEVGPVVFPAYTQTSASVRSALTAIVSDHELRAALASVIPEDDEPELRDDVELDENREENDSTSETAASPSTEEEAATDESRTDDVDDAPAETTRRTKDERKRLVRSALMEEVFGNADPED